MKIQPRLDSIAADAAAGPGVRRAGAKPAAAPASDQVHLSALAKEATANVADTGTFDAAKVSAIKQAIAEGRMQVDAGAIADRLIAQAQALAMKDRG